ncbi:MAG: RNB domain-containing ribonuclease [Xanthomonadales bacterium]|nr:RNB domain-containing ribonuclease [Xanthomonadales bacterium]
MTATRRLRCQTTSDRRLEQGLVAIRRELELPDGFDAMVEGAAEAAVAQARWPDLDRSDIPFVTIDPAGARDLDQALHLERRGTGYRVHYAIADVAAFVRPGDAIDVEARARGETLYGADTKIPLHPKALSEDAASLLPNQLRPALLWSIDLDAGGEITATDVRRARVKSRAQLDYDGVQALIDGGRHDPVWGLLREVGELRQACEKARGGISLPLPSQEISVDEAGKWQLAFRARHPVEDWNAQISLLTGMAAAELMLRHRIGILRTLPSPAAIDIERLRRSASALGVAWPQSLDYPAFIRSLDPRKPAHVAMMVDATSVLRGAAYVAFDGELPEQGRHSALAANYAHTTAPLRRLVDRFVGEICVALCAKAPVPDWVREALPTLPGLMAQSNRRASAYERAVLDLAESVALSARVGDVFDANVIDVDARDARRGQVMLREPAVTARIEAAQALPLGETVRARLLESDPGTRRTRFVWAV